MQGLFIRTVADLSPFRQNTLDLLVRTRDNMYAYQLPNTPRGRGTGVGSRFDRPDIATHKNGHIPGAYVFLADKLNVCRLYHRIGSFYRTYKALRFDHT